MKETTRVSSYIASDSQVTHIINWDDRTIVTEDGEVVNIHAERDKMARERRRLDLEVLNAEKDLAAEESKVWLSEKAEAEGGKNPRKITGVELDKMVAKMYSDGKSKVSEAWVKLQGIRAKCWRTTDIFWSLKELVDMDNRRG